MPHQQPLLRVAVGRNRGMARRASAWNAHANEARHGTRGVPTGTQGVPVPPTPQVPPGTPPESVAAAQAAASDPNARRGVPQQSPSQSGKPHSLTPEWWDNVNNSIAQASAAAARAGQDPAQVSQSLTAMRNSFFQGEVLKNLSAANVALMNRDQAAVEKAIRNVYYYFPDGRDLQVHRGPKGELQYQDAINPTKADGSPNYVDVMAQHLQILGQAALDPMQVANTLQQYRMLPQHAACADEGSGRARYGPRMGGVGAGCARSFPGGCAACCFAELPRPVRRGPRPRQGGEQRIRAAPDSCQAMRLDPTAAKAANDAAQQVDTLALGPPRQVPDTDSAGDPNLSVAAGKVIHDTSRADPALSRASAQDIAQVKAWAAGLVAGNPRGMTPQDAAATAAEAYRRSKATHPGPDGKPVNDVQIDRQRGMLHVWDKRYKGWRNYPLAQGTALPMGSVPPGLFSLACCGRRSDGRCWHPAEWWWWRGFLEPTGLG